MRKLMVFGACAVLMSCGDTTSSSVACVDAPCPRTSDAEYIRTGEGSAAERFWDQADRNCLVFHPGPSGDIGDAALREALESAARTWSAAAEACQAAVCVRVGARVDSPDGRNVVYVVDDAARWRALQDSANISESEGQRLGVCLSRFEPGGRLVGADIAINRVEFEFSQRPDGPIGAEQDLESVILHELGHALGFAHTDDGVDSVMMQSLSMRIQRRLTDIDRAGVCETFARPESAANRRRDDAERNALPPAED